MMFKAVLLLAVVAVASAQTDVNFRPCTGGHLTPRRVTSTQCTATLCTLTRGQVFTARAYFSPRESFSQLLVAVSASIFGINFPMSIPNGYEDACNFLGAGSSCPVHNDGVEHVWELQFPVDTSYPLVNNLVVRLAAGEGGRTAACAIVDARIVAN